MSLQTKLISSLSRKACSYWGALPACRIRSKEQMLVLDPRTIASLRSTSSRTHRTKTKTFLGPYPCLDLTMLADASADCPKLLQCTMAANTPLFSD